MDSFLWELAFWTVSQQLAVDSIDGLIALLGREFAFDASSPNPNEAVVTVMRRCCGASASSWSVSEVLAYLSCLGLPSLLDSEDLQRPLDGNSATLLMAMLLGILRGINWMQQGGENALLKQELETALLTAEETLEQQLILQGELDQLTEERDRLLRGGTGPAAIELQRLRESEAVLKAELEKALLTAEETLEQQLALQAELDDAVAERDRLRSAASSTDTGAIVAELGQLRQERDALIQQAAHARRDWESAKALARTESQQRASLEADVGRLKSELGRAKSEAEATKKAKGVAEDASLKEAQSAAAEKAELTQALESTLRDHELTLEQVLGQQSELEALQSQLEEAHKALALTRNAEALLKGQLEQALLESQQSLEQLLGGQQLLEQVHQRHFEFWFVGGLTL